jgi:hypothetical protein
MELMGILFVTNVPEACCLCGATENLSGEHKIKASAIRAEFGTDKIVIGRFGESVENVRNVQGPKSKNLHFQAKICRKCNSERTQAADREFDKFHMLVRAKLEAGEDPASVFELNHYAEGSSPYLNVFRYFAKLLCCHIGDAKGPRPVRLARFAISELDANCVWLSIDRDVVHQEFSQVHGELQYVAHGGLVVYGHKKTGGATGFHSTLTIGPVRYVYFMRSRWAEQLELRLLHPKFHKWVKTRTVDSIEQPLTEEERRRLGL